MRHNFNSILVALLIFSAASVWGQIAMGQVTMKFPATRDAGIAAHATNQMNHGGAVGQVRPLKTHENAMIVDFDTAAMGAFLAANPGTAVWTLGIKVSDNAINTGNFHDISVLTVESINDWAESTGAQNNINFNWTQTQAAATYFYAQTRYTGAANTVAGLPGTDPGNSNATLDVANSLEWIDPDSGPYTFNTSAPQYATYGVPPSVGGGGANPTPAFTNSQSFNHAQLSNDRLNDVFSTIVIDNVIIDALVNDEYNRGLRFGPIANTISSNWRINDRNQSGGLFAPYLEVTITAIPEPSTMLLGAMASLGMLLRRRR